MNESLITSCFVISAWCFPIWKYDLLWLDIDSILVSFTLTSRNILKRPAVDGQRRCYFDIFGTLCPTSAKGYHSRYCFLVTRKDKDVISKSKSELS